MLYRIKRHPNFFPALYEKAIFYDRYRDLWHQLNEADFIDVNEKVYLDVKKYVELIQVLESVKKTSSKLKITELKNEDNTLESSEKEKEI